MARPTKPEGTTADRIVAFRLTPIDEALLVAIVAANVKKLAAEGIIASVRTTDVVRTLIRREAERLGVSAGAVDPPQAKPEQKKTQPSTRKTPPKASAPAPTTAADVHRELLRALDAGVTASELATAAGVDKGQMSRFKKEGAGLSDTKLEALGRTVRKFLERAA